MRLRRFTLPVLLLVACATLSPAGSAAADDEKTEPEVVTVQHILISFGRKSGKKIDRDKRTAERLASEILERARDGEDFDALVKEYTNDSYPGIFTMTNRGAPLRANSTTRDGMVPGFGDVSFGLEVGEIGMAKYHAALSPYGWHIIKRLE